MPGSRKAVIHSETRLFDDFFKIDEVMVSHQRQDGTMSPDQRRLIFERGDSVAALLYNPETNDVVVVNQFKVSTLQARRRDNPIVTDGWVTETIAGMIDPGESPEEAIIRETEEETGYKIHDPLLISQFFSSPGGTSERIFLYFAAVKATDRINDGGGTPGEDVKVIHMSANDLFEQLLKKQIEDPKLIIAAYWLQDYMRRIPPLDHSIVEYELVEKPGLFVGYMTGSLEGITSGVSIWVNSENTDMMMDRFIGRTISAKIRYLGANKDDESIVEDTIQESLRGVIGERAHVKIGTVLVTESGMLSASHQVERIFHVATVEGGPGTGVKADPDKLKYCVDRVLKRADQENNKLWRIIRNKHLESIIFPMLGAGDGGLTPEMAAENIIPVAINYFRATANPTLKKIYFLAFKARDRSACAKVLDEACTAGLLKRSGSSYGKA